MIPADNVIVVGSQKSSVRSRDSTINNTSDQKKLQRTYSLHSNSEFDETALSCDADVSSLGVEGQDSSVIDGAKSEGSESESENLFAWRDRIRGISDATNMSTQNSIKETSSWADIYDSNPDIELTVLLLQVRAVPLSLTSVPLSLTSFPLRKPFSEFPLIFHSNAKVISFSVFLANSLLLFWVTLLNYCINFLFV